MRLSPALVFLATFTPLTSAVPIISSPAPGASLPGGSAITVTWKDDGNAPALAALASYQLFLYTGSSTNPTSLYSAVPAGQFSTGNTATVTVPVAIGGATANA